MVAYTERSNGFGNAADGGRSCRRCTMGRPFAYFVGKRTRTERLVDQFGSCSRSSSSECLTDPSLWCRGSCHYFCHTFVDRGDCDLAPCGTTVLRFLDSVTF